MHRWILTLTFLFFLSCTAYANNQESKIETILNIQPEYTAGLYSHLMRMIEWIYCIKQTEQFGLYVNWNGLYQFNGNLFSALFKQFEDPQIFTTPIIDAVYQDLSPSFPANFPGFKRFPTDGMKNFPSRWVYCTPALYTDPDFSLFRERLHPLIVRYLQLEPGLQKRIDRITRKMNQPNNQSALTQTNRKIGFHVRCMWHYQNNITADEVIQFIDHIERDIDQVLKSRDLNTTTIFLATLLEPLVQRLSAKYKLVVCNIPRTSNTWYDWVNMPMTSNVRAARAAIVDAWCLANCDEIWCGVSNMTTFVACLNPNLEVHLLPTLEHCKGN